jgi:membrane associated rhomboid family serine protease
MRLKYNAPTTLTFAFLCAAVLILNQSILPDLTRSWFAVGPGGSFSAANPRCWITLVTHVAGHADWSHLISNFSLILLVGPILEANYGSRALLLMIICTALITGILNILLFPGYLMGASGVVFMMILLASFTNITEGEIPLTFILILFLYIGREVFDSFRQDNISEFTHIIGGLCGSLFGIFRAAKKGK